MDLSGVLFERDGIDSGRYRTAVSLHGHTLFSEESLGFIYRLARRCVPLRLALRTGEVRYRKAYSTTLDLKRAFWTPPVAPHDAWRIECENITARFGLEPLVSLTDHDRVEACNTLRVLEECRDLPISVEWTVPFGETFFHLGIHNLQPSLAAELCLMREHVGSPRLVALEETLTAITSARDSLVVFNHPAWDECGIGLDAHQQLATAFARRYQRWIHAFEFNGLRPWEENRRAVRMAAACGKPVISGGGRHALEPNTVLNVSASVTFSEFAEEVRCGWSRLLITNQYMQPFSIRLLHNLEDCVADHPGHGRGWVNWNQRVFYRCDDGVSRPVSELWKQTPAAVAWFVTVMHTLRNSGMRQLFRPALPRKEGVTP